MIGKELDNLLDANAHGNMHGGRVKLELVRLWETELVRYKNLILGIDARTTVD